MCICVRMCVYVRVYVSECVFICVYMCVNVYMCVYVCVCVYLCPPPFASSLVVIRTRLVRALLLAPLVRTPFSSLTSQLSPSC